ncbi:MAG: MFS transporter [Parvularcula sp.]|nr:MFS transporter [Parvularcula sp.]
MASRLGRAAAYGIGDFGLNLYWNASALFLVFWYVNVAGLPPQTAGLIFAIGLVGDFLLDPVVASLAERVQSPMGTYRPFLLVGAPLLGGSFALLFVLPSVSDGAAVLFFLATLLVFRASYTLVSVPYSALASRLTFVSEERTEIAGVRMFFALSGLLLVAAAYQPLADAFAVDGSEGFFSAATITAALATMAIMTCGLLSHELPPPGATSSARAGVAAFATQLRTNDALRIFLGAVLFQASAAALLLILLPFYLEIQEPGSGGGTLIGYALGNVLAVPLWTLTARRIGKRRTWFISGGVVVLSGLVLASGGTWQIASVPLAVLSMGVGFAAFAVLVWAIAPDVVEYGQAGSGRRSEAPVFALLLMTQKLAGGFTALAAGALIAWSGYEPGRPVQHEAVAMRLGLVFTLLPAGLVGLSCIFINWFPLNRNIHREIIKRLQEDDGAKATEESSRCRI